MEQKILFALVLATYITLMGLESATGRTHGLKYHHHRYHSHTHNSNYNRNQNHPDSSSEEVRDRKRVKSTTPAWPSPYEDDYESEEDPDRHAYLMTKNKKSKSTERITEDETLTKAFEKHMKPGTSNQHDVYAYQLPSDLWFIVRYAKNEEGEPEKYMNVVDSFTNYLEKLEDKDVQTVSVNVKGVETVFRLTPKRKPDN